MVNISQVKTATGGESKASVKLHSLIASTAVVSVVAGFLLNGGFLLYGTILLIIFLSLFILEIFFISQTKLLSVATGANAIAFALPFFALASLYFAGVFIVFTIFLYQGAFRGRHELQNMLKIHFARVTRVITTPLITAVIIFLSAALILSSNFSIKKERVDQVVNITAPALVRFVGDFSGNTEARILFSNFARENAIKDDNFLALPSVQQEFVINKSAEELSERLEESLGVQIELSNSVSENVHEIATTKLDALTPRGRLMWSLIAIATIWLSVRTVEFIVYVPLAVLTFLLYELLFTLGFVSIKFQSRDKEFISLE